jgi:hypothetical protein
MPSKRLGSNRCQILWAKTLSRGDSGATNFSTSPFSTRMSPVRRTQVGDKSQSTLWEEKKPAANQIHPTAKRVELIERAVLNINKGGDNMQTCSADLGPP